MSRRIRVQGEPVTTRGENVQGFVQRRIDASSTPTFVVVIVNFVCEFHTVTRPKGRN
jgi:hypothetical protein